VALRQGATLPFDRVVLTDGGGRKEISLGDFLTMPLPKRIEHILARTLEFYSGDTLVDRKVALAGLRGSST
jgi:hypothetical protein